MGRGYDDPGTICQTREVLHAVSLASHQADPETDIYDSPHSPFPPSAQTPPGPMAEHPQQTRQSPDAASPMSWGSAEGGADEEELREACGVFGCVVARNTPEGSVNASQVIYLGLVALQHRGQESAGIVTSEGLGCKQFHYHKGEGLVASTFRDENLQKLKGHLGIGHTRYATMGGRDPSNIQPFMVHTRHGPFATAHNGELINGVALRKTVLERGVGLSTRSDSELITQMLSLTPPRGREGRPDWGLG
ncbi:putative amidophosphoribosyltransferase-like [Penaeus vannamei]|uniref:Putative amidophosphoribosyltransferase-like n=1 Tax=Penaeus vannamei TaxID=6689 RepID=A0A3R7T1E7_PENVA|nr:putative amidophosphoribosyltransferase-like [Penaeus vannamei]